jgi:hypothetical protein
VLDIYSDKMSKRYNNYDKRYRNDKEIDYKTKGMLTQKKIDSSFRLDGTEDSTRKGME